jgi:hypothetical protein
MRRLRFRRRPDPNQGRYRMMAYDFFDTSWPIKNAIFFGNQCNFYYGGRTCEDTDFVNCNYSKGDFQDTIFTNASFVGCDLTGTSFNGAYLDRVDFDTDVCLVGAYLSTRSPLPAGYIRAGGAGVPCFRDKELKASMKQAAPSAHFTYDRLEYDLAGLGPEAHVLIAEHPGITPARLRALSHAVSVLAP